MKRLCPLLLSLLVFLTLSSFNPSQEVFSQGGTVVKVSPALVNLEPGQSATIEILIDNVVDLRAFEVDIVFDQSRMYVPPSSLSAGSFLGSGLNVPDNGVDNDTGTITFGKAIIGDDVQSGSGAIFTFQVQAKANAGDGLITIVSAVLVNAAYGEIPHSLQHGTVVISGEGGSFQVFLPLILR